MDDATLGRLFRAFEPDNTVHRTHGGTGLGLSISKKLVELWGGRIHARSQPSKSTTTTINIEHTHTLTDSLARWCAGVGSTFGFTCNARSATPALIGELSLQQRRQLGQLSPSSLMIDASLVAIAAPLAGSTVLLVDDGSGGRVVGVMAPWFRHWGL